MKAYEFPARITAEGKLEFSDLELNGLPPNQNVKVIILVDEQSDTEALDWNRLAAEQFLAGYLDSDAVYDRM